MTRRRKAKKILKKRVIAGVTYHLKTCFKKKSSAKARARATRAKTTRRAGKLARILFINGKHCVYVH